MFLLVCTASYNVVISWLHYWGKHIIKYFVIHGLYLVLNVERSGLKFIDIFYDNHCCLQMSMPFSVSTWYDRGSVTTFTIIPGIHKCDSE